MQAIEVLYNHTLADLTDEDQIFEAADLNGIGITDALTPGVTLLVPTASRKSLTKELAQQPVKKETVTALPGQNWIDLVLQQTGDESKLFDFIDLNSAGITDDVQAGSTYNSMLPEAERLAVVKAITKRKPSSVFIGIDNPAPEGIEYWAIELDFIVSADPEPEPGAFKLDFSDPANSQYINVIF